MLKFEKSYDYYIDHGWGIMYFKPENVEPYYDMFESGRIRIYVTITETRYRIFKLFPYEVTNTYSVMDDNVHITETTPPIRMNCGERDE